MFQTERGWLQAQVSSLLFKVRGVRDLLGLWNWRLRFLSPYSVWNFFFSRWLLEAIKFHMSVHMLSRGYLSSYTLRWFLSMRQILSFRVFWILSYRPDTHKPHRYSRIQIDKAISRLSILTSFYIKAPRSIYFSSKVKY